MVENHDIDLSKQRVLVALKLKSDIQIEGKKDYSIVDLFCDEDVNDKDLFEGEYSGKILRTFIGLADTDGNQALKGNCFIGVNVKTSLNEPLKPISFRTTENMFEYVADPTCVAKGGRITDMVNPLQEVAFRWDPQKWSYEEEKKHPDGYKGAVVEENNPEIIRLFKSPFGSQYDPKLGLYNPETNKDGNKYNILGDIYNNALQLDGECWVWIHHFDYDIDSGGKFLSFVLAVGDKRDDFLTLMGRKKDDASTKEADKQENVLEIWDSPRNKLRNYIMLVKARYVKRLEHQRQVESVKSAVAAIMSRNMSHNLGSHYLYYAKNQLASMADEQEKSAPDIRGAAKVLGYMQARMDYLATIVSGDKYPYGSVFFKGQIFDELTIDDFSRRHFEKDGKGREYKRTTNYLLQNLIMSENFTRGSVLDEVEGGMVKLPEGKRNIRLQIITEDGSVFTGIGNETGIKLAISKLCIALPGGIMSIHAFFNIVENLIRNSAKYRKEDIREEGLVYTIAIKELETSEDEKMPALYQFVIFDNKANANNPYSSTDSMSLIGKMNQQLVELKIYDNVKNRLDKNSKGLKEMLFSTLWMRAYTYENGETLSESVAKLDRYDIDSKDAEVAKAAREEKRLELKKHAFEYVAVDDQGKICTNKETPCNLGIRFELPKYRMMENLDTKQLEIKIGDSDEKAKEELNALLVKKGVNNFSDILCVETERKDVLAELKNRFTRVYPRLVMKEDNVKEAVEALRSILRERFDHFDKYKVSMSGADEDGFGGCNTKKYGIYFKTHLSDIETMENYSYSEAVSGENFTKTMESIFISGLSGGRDTNDATNYFCLKIKEAALTRITLIDERLYNDMMDHPEKRDVLKYKNIRVLNMKETPDFRAKQSKEEQESFFKKALTEIRSLFGKKLKVRDVFDGIDFRDGKDGTHFLSIHLGMIEKIVKDDSPWIKVLGLEKASLDERVNELMKWLRKTFTTSKGEVFISIHSGRGNFSPDLDNSLKHYRFISISALESVYANSKFLLAQLFYNTVYIGKGDINSTRKGE